MVIVLALVLSSGMYAVACALSATYPSSRTSARDRLLKHNPGLRRRTDVRWSVAARRVPTTRAQAVVVGVALLVATSRPVGQTILDR